MTGVGPQAKIHAIMGSSGGGKSTRLRAIMAKPKRTRTMIWSPKEAKDRYVDMYPGSVLCTSMTEVLQILKAAGARGSFHIVFKPPLVRKVDEKLFHVFCKMALVTENLAFVAEEIHTVTRATWAPDGWSELVMMGRDFKIEIFGLSQRPASMDKDFLGNCSTVHTRRLSHPGDAEAVAKAIGVKAADVSALHGFMWLERNNQTGIVTRG
jgi:ABC-type cobalamin/Fe3+-siderophores transport system ATPase subunit